VYEFQDAAAAFDAVDKGETFGKTVIRVAAP
jgi:hypothetical protein